MIGLIYMKKSRPVDAKSCSHEPGTSPRELPATFLKLPDAPDFVSRPPDISLAENIKLCEEMLTTWNRRRFESGVQLPMITEPFYL